MKEQFLKQISGHLKAYNSSSPSRQNNNLGEKMAENKSKRQHKDTLTQQQKLQQQFQSQPVPNRKSLEAQIALQQQKNNQIDDESDLQDENYENIEEDDSEEEESKYATNRIDPSQILKQMSQEQIVQLLRDPEISRILKESMLQQEKEDTGYLVDLEDIMPIRDLNFNQHEARQVDPMDPSILGNEFEVQQEKTLNTDDFQFTGLPPQYAKPRLYVPQGQGFDDDDDGIDQEHLDYINNMIQDYVDEQEQYENDSDEKPEQAFNLSGSGENKDVMGLGVVNIENLQSQSDSSSLASDYNLALQLFDGEEMNAGMANFIGIHRMQSLNSPKSIGVSGDGGDDAIQSQELVGLNYSMPFSVNADELREIFGSGEAQEQYMCPNTGAHFHKADLYQRIMRLQKRRALIDHAIAEETRIQQQVEIKNQKQQPVNKSTISQILAKQNNSNYQQQKNGRNKQPVLGYGRQNLTDGNAERVFLEINTSDREIDQEAGGAISSGHGGGVAKEIDDMEGGLEDAQAIIVNAGKAKYVSNGSSKQNKGQFLSIKQLEAPMNESGITVQPGVKGTKIQNQISSKSFMVSASGGNTSGGGVSSNKDTSHLKNFSLQNQPSKKKSQQLREGLLTQQIEAQDAQQKIVPPHERMLQFASSGQYTVENQPIKNQADFVKGFNYKRRGDSAEYEQQQALKDTMIKSTDMMNLPSAYHSHDYRRQAPATKNSSTTNAGGTTTKAFGGKTETSNTSQRVQMGIPSGKQSMRQQFIQKSVLDTENSLKQSQNASANAYNSQTQVVQYKPSMKPMGGKTIVGGTNTKKKAQQDSGMISGPKKLESVSFDNRKQQVSKSKELVAPGQQLKGEQIVQAQNEASMAYRSMDPRNNSKVNSALHPSQNTQLDQQYWSQGRQIQTQQQQQHPVQLIGVKSSQIEGGSSRIVSKISIQKAKKRQKQMVSAALQSAKATTGSSGQPHHQVQIKNQNMIQSFHKQIIPEAPPTGSDGNISKRQNKLQPNINEVLDNINANKQQNQQKNIQPASNKSSQIEQVEQFYAMLSGHQVIFTGRGNNQNQGNGSMKIGNDATKKQGQGPHFNKPQGNQAKGTHARTNTLDYRAAAAKASKQQTVAQRNNNDLQNRLQVDRKSLPIQQQPGKLSFTNAKRTSQEGSLSKGRQQQQQPVQQVFSNNENLLVGRSNSGGGRARVQSKKRNNQASLTGTNNNQNTTSLTNDLQQQQRQVNANVNAAINSFASNQIDRYKSNKSISGGRGRNQPKATHSSKIQQVSKQAQALKQSINWKQQPISTNYQIVQKVLKQSLGEAQQLQKYKVQQQMQSPPQANSQRAILQNKQNPFVGVNRQGGGGGSSGPGANPSYYMTDQSQPLTQSLAVQGYSNISSNKPDQLAKSYNSVPIKSYEQTAQQSNNYLPGYARDFQQQRVETDNVSDNYSACDQLNEPSVEENENLNFVKQYYGKLAKQSQNQMIVGGGKTSVLSSTKHRKSNSLGYKVVMKDKQQPQNLDKNAVLNIVPSGHEQDFATDVDTFQLFKTFNDKRTQMGKADILVDQDKRQQLAHRHGSGRGATSGQMTETSANKAQPQSMGLQHSQHRRNTSMYQQSFNSQNSGLLIDNNGQQVQQQMLQHQLQNNQHKKSHSMNYQQQQSNHPQKQVIVKQAKNATARANQPQVDSMHMPQQYHQPPQHQQNTKQQRSGFVNQQVQHLLQQSSSGNPNANKTNTKFQ